MTAVTIFSTGLSNIDSICRALEICGADVRLARKADEIKLSDRLVLPGVGSFSAVMGYLETHGVVEEIQQHVASHRPFLGICLGMQMMAEHSEEMGHTKGLNIIPGTVSQLQTSHQEERVPHIGWNSVVHDDSCLLFDGIASGTDFYFAHSYHYICRNPEHSLARTNSFGGFTAAVGCDGQYGVQFHPEKSQKPGLALLKNFLAI